MAEIKVNRRKVPSWPWLAGLAVLAVLILTIAKLVDSRVTRQLSTDSVNVSMGDTAGAGSGPSADNPVLPPPSSTLEALAPLGVEDLSQRVVVSGEVMGSPGAEGFWVLTDENMLIFVRGAPLVKSGARAEGVIGVLIAAKAGEAERWEAAAKLKEARDWTVVRDLFVRVGNAPPRDTVKTPEPKKPAAPKPRPAKN